MSDQDTRNVSAGQPFQDKLNEIYTRLLQQTSVATANKNSEAAGKRVEQLKESRKKLVARAAELADEITKLAGECESSFIERYAGDQSQPDVSGKLGSLSALEHEHKIVTHAVAQITDHLLPKAEIQEIRAVADYSSAQAESLREVAAERLQKTQELIAGAKEHEGELAFDPAQTVSGVLQAQAAQLDTVAQNQRNIAHEREQEYLKMQRQQSKVF
ncbi:MAG TPA: hypothetical protein VJN43_09115 [Bryobacteraceae bacterium]|nr:hypothetical protein [Bryobacteraceae bacterium]